MAALTVLHILGTLCIQIATVMKMLFRTILLPAFLVTVLQGW